jgi:hypothetical protein
VFYLEIVQKGPVLLVFIWAYSQYALVNLVIPGAGPATWVLQGVTWFLFYVVLSFGLWTLLGRSSSSARGVAWRRAILGWVVAQLMLALGAAGALYAGIIEME